MQNVYAATDQPAAALSVDARAAFIVRTYVHLFGSILAFTALEILLFKSGVAASIAPALAGNWLLVLGAFVVVSWLASGASHRVQSLPGQYAALAAYVAAEALIFVPLLYVADSYADGVIQSAAVVTLGGFGLLTFVAFWTRKDFSFLGGLLRFVSLAVLGGIVASLLLGFTLGTWFSVGMIALAGAAVLYDTSNVLHHYPEDRHVAASLQLFASVALMFWYVLRLFLGNRR